MERVFVDYFESTVPDRSIFRMIAKPVQVGCCCIQSLSMIYHCLDYECAVDRSIIFDLSSGF